MRRLIFSKANHQLESRIQEIWQSGSEGGAKPTFVPTPIATPRSRPVGYGVIRAGVRTDSMIGVTEFRMRKLKTFMLYGFRFGFIKPFQTSETLLGNRAMAHSALVSRRFRKRSITSSSSSNIIGHEPFKKRI